MLTAASSNTGTHVIPTVSLQRRSREADSFHISHIASIGQGNDFFYSGRIRTHVAMASYSFHIIIMEKAEMAISAVSFGIFENNLQKCLLSSPPRFIFFTNNKVTNMRNALAKRISSDMYTPYEGCREISSSKNGKLTIPKSSHYHIF